MTVASPFTFKWPFTWEDRHPVYQQGVFFLPDFYDKHDRVLLPSFGEIFGNSAPICIEYCSGNGAWILEKASQRPECNWVAVEIRFDRARKIWKKAAKAGLKNVLVVLGEGVTFSKHYLDRASVSEIFVNFPDPWPKDRHAKHRIIQSPFVQEMARIVAASGKMTLVTDDSTYAEQMRQVTLGSNLWNSLLPEPFYTHEMEGYGTSYFRELWESKAKSIFFHQFSPRYVL